METNDKKYEVSVMEVTPQMAKDWLKRNPYNRQIRETSVNHLAFQMKNGLWRENVSQPIAIDEDGNLLDGQHRLTAVTKAGIPVKMAVMYGAKKADFFVIDTGRPRGISDALYVKGVKSNSSVACIIRAFWQIKRNILDAHSTTLCLTSEIAYEEYMQSPDLYDIVAKSVNRIYSNTRLLNVSEMGGISIFLIKERHHTFEEVERFFEDLTRGGDYNAMRQFRQMVTRSNNAPTYKQKMTPTVRRALIAKAWNAYITKIDVKSLQYKSSDKIVWL